MRWTLFSRRRPRIDEASWSRALACCDYARALPATERGRLRALTEEFLGSKSFDGAAGFEPSAADCVVIALKACVPILHLGIDYYAGWSDIVVYPTDFRVEEEYTDGAGVVHRNTRDLCGQSLSRGPMVLSWEAVLESGSGADRDVVMHECAHKLDVLNGTANGFPPLHAHMSPGRWTQVFRAAFEQLRYALHTGADAGLDSYAATDPAEFFAVATETFFTRPAAVRRYFPAAYTELAEFYRQDSIAILGPPA